MSTDLNAAQQAAADEAEAHIDATTTCKRCGLTWEFHAPLEVGQSACRADVPKMTEKIKRLDEAVDCLLIGIFYCGVPHAGERHVLKEVVEKAMRLRHDLPLEGR